MDFKETLQMIESAGRTVYPMEEDIDYKEVTRSATRIYIANLPKKNMVEGLQKAKECVEDRSYYTCDGRAILQKDVLKILDELMESVGV
jgi:hypothetical protein